MLSPRSTSSSSRVDPLRGSVRAPARLGLPGRRWLGIGALVCLPAGVALAGGGVGGGVAVEWILLVAVGLLPGWLFVRRALG